MSDSDRAVRRQSRSGSAFSLEMPPCDELFALFETTGWNEFYRVDAEEYHATVAASWYSVFVREGERLIGMGRMICDGLLHALIIDLIVLPEEQGRGVGDALLKKLVSHCDDHGIRDIQLFSARDKAAWYEKRGFVKRDTTGPGMQLLR